MSDDDVAEDDALFGDAPFKREPFRRDEAWHYTGHSEYRVLIDPAWIELGDPQNSFTRLNLLVNYARKVTTPTKIELLFPKYLKPPKARRWEGAFFRGPCFRVVGPPTESHADRCDPILAAARSTFGALAAEFARDPAAARSEADLDRLIYGGLLFGRPEGRQLLDLSIEYRCDFLLTENPWLLETSPPLRSEGVWPAGPEDVLEMLQLGLRASGVFIEVINPLLDVDWGVLGRARVGAEGLGFSHFYPMESRILLGYQQWFHRVAEHVKAERLWPHGRAAFYHRFPFMLYAHDQVRYHALYSQRFASDNRYRGDHRFFLAYHLNAFYVMLAALLDNIAWIWNYALGCGFQEHDSSRNKCVLNHKEFRKRVGKLRPDFVALIEDADIAEWLANLGLKRHPAVHREPLFLTHIFERGSGKLLWDSASVITEPTRVIVFDLLGAADADLKMLHQFLARMEALPPPRGPDDGTSAAF